MSPAVRNLLRAGPALVAFGALLATSGCVYYNTFFNAKRAYEDAEKARIEQQQRLRSTENRRSTASGPRRTAARRARASGSSEQLYRSAIEKSAKVLAYYPTSAYVDDALLLMAKSYFRLHEYTASLKKCDELLSSFPSSPFVPEARYWRAMALWKLGKQEEASLALGKIINNTSAAHRGDAAFALAGLERARGDLDGAIEHYRVAVRQAKDPLFRTDAQKALGECLLEANRPGEAVKYYQELARDAWSTKDRYSAYIKMASAQRMMGDYDGAISTLKPLLTDERFHEFIPRTRIETAIAYEGKGETEAAVLLYQEVLDEAARQLPRRARSTVQRSPSSAAKPPPTPQTAETAEAHYRLGLLQEKHFHNYAKAAEDYRAAAQNQAFEVGPAAKERQDALARWSELHAALSDTSDSTKWQSRDLVLYTLAEHFLLNLEDTDSAFAYFQTVVDSFPAGNLAPKARYAIGWLWLNMRGDTARADSAWEPILADTTGTLVIRGLQRDIRKWLGRERPDPALALYRQGEVKWLGALEDIPPWPPDTLAEDSLALAHWWDRWRERHRARSELYTPIFERVVREYPESPYATRARFILGWAAENVTADTSAARAWYRRARKDTLVFPEIAMLADSILTFRAEKTAPVVSSPDSVMHETQREAPRPTSPTESAQSLPGEPADSLRTEDGSAPAQAPSPRPRPQ